MLKATNIFAMMIKYYCLLSDDKCRHYIQYRNDAESFLNQIQ
ncbi:hypothetical protein HMPREF1555_00986 [Porphyromonas gingivalis F0570]|uniref:Uncharacterized protein n=1 Tax=Porphyromonas gingivalis F0570 TaxID=1227271 RepID=A0A0E2LRK7_PORGN|nr:hypothetical protein HMPREF1555_00986 [Porphyromonas gingivalis F0570]